MCVQLRLKNRSSLPLFEYVYLLPRTVHCLLIIFLFIQARINRGESALRKIQRDKGIDIDVVPHS